MNSILRLFQEQHDQYRIKINFNTVYNEIQSEFLEELKAKYLKYLNEKNLRKLRELGDIAHDCIVPDNFCLGNFDRILTTLKFPIEMIWIDGRPLNSLIPIIYFTQLENYSPRTVVISELENSTIQENADQIVRPRNLFEFKKIIKDFNGWFHLDGHTTNNHIEIGNLRLYANDLPKSFLFLNACNTYELVKLDINGRAGIFQRTKIKDETAKQFSDTFYRNILRGNSVPVVLRDTIRKYWKKDCSVLGYIYCGTENFFIDQSQKDTGMEYIYKKSGSKFEEMFNLVDQPDFSEFYSEEEFITWNGFQLSRTDLFNGYLKEDQVEIKFNDLFYEPPELLEQLKEGLLEYKYYTHKKLFGTEPDMSNGEVIRINKLGMINTNKLVLEVTPVYFHDLMISNLSPEVYIESIDMTIREKFCSGPKFSSVEESELPNQVGVGALLITRDNYLVFQQRSKKTLLTHVSQLGLTSSIAGYVKNRQEYYIDGKPSIFQAVRAQVEEELGIHNDQIYDLHLIGISRSMETCGSISFRFVGRIDLSRSEFENQWMENNPKDHWEYKKLLFKLLPNQPNEKIEKIRKYTKSYKHNIPSATLVSLYYYEKMLSNDSK